MKRALAPSPLDEEGGRDNAEMNTAAALVAWQQRAMRKARPPRQDDGDDDRDHHVAWLQETGDGGEDVGERDSDGGGGEQDAVIPWLANDQDEASVQSSRSTAKNETEHAQESPRHSERDQEDGEGDETVEDFSDEWADKYLSPPVCPETAPSVSAAPSTTSLPLTSDTADGWKRPNTPSEIEHHGGGMTKLFAGYGGHRNSFRNEIDLVKQATEKAAAAAMETAKTQEPTSRLKPVARF
ncbi:hypothetical protein FI667_g1441, partial [Globisporangium splendens]